jgi:hypothetical protein
MTTPEFDQDWEQLWSKTLREHGEKVARHVATWPLSESDPARPAVPAD